jgi:hypothetical protein
MVDPQPIYIPEFAEQSAEIDPEVVIQATGVPKAGNGQSRKAQAPAPATDGQALQQAMRPMVQGIEAIARAQFEQAEILGRLEAAMRSQEALPVLLTETKQAIELKNAVNRSMFEALHTELKSYKDGFLLDAVLKPVIRDLISLFDDITEIHRQLTLALGTHQQRGEPSAGEVVLVESVSSPIGRLDHNRDSILEALERLGVTRIESNMGKLDKRTQRAVTLEMVENPEEDQQVARIVRCGFQWRDRLIRPEEVVIKKWQEGYLAALDAAAEKK